MILTVLKLHSPKGSCNFENCQNHSYLLITNCTRDLAISCANNGHIHEVANSIISCSLILIGQREVFFCSVLGLFDRVQ